MPDIQDIRKYMDTWGQMTYKSGLDYCYEIKNNASVLEICTEVLKKQRLFEKKMDGYSVQNIPCINEGKTDIIFTNIFWKLAKIYITPVSYIGSVVNECTKKEISNIDEICGIVGRALRAFPSFLREMDLAYKLSRFMHNSEIVTGPEQDIGDHTDILIKYNNVEYRVWSYQNYDRGLYNTAQRFYGNRGNIPKGIHVLCPIDISNKNVIENVDGWFFYSEKYVHYLFEMISFEKPDSYAEIRRLEQYALKLYLKKPNIVSR